MRIRFFMLLSASTLLIGSVAAQAQTAADIQATFVRICLGQGHPPAFCSCWAQAALQMMTPEENAILRNGGSTPDLDRRANGACAQYLPR
jgi:hypothetical protein